MPSSTLRSLITCFASFLGEVIKGENEAHCCLLCSCLCPTCLECTPADGSLSRLTYLVLTVITRLSRSLSTHTDTVKPSVEYFLFLAFNPHAPHSCSHLFTSWSFPLSLSLYFLALFLILSCTLRSTFRWRCSIAMTLRVERFMSLSRVSVSSFPYSQDNPICGGSDKLTCFTIMSLFRTLIA